MVGILISAGALVDAQDKNGNTPLSNAVFEYRGDGATILALVGAGASPDIVNAYGVSARELARTIDDSDAAKFFK